VDIDLLRTFLEVLRTRHFGRASENLFLTQSAVSARIRQLEDTVGSQLFTRDRNDIQLTPAGSRLLKHAEAIVIAWNRAQQEVLLGGQDKISLAIGAMPSLWDVLLEERIHQLYRERPNIALQIEAHGAEALIRKLLDGALDLVFMFEPPQITELLEREVAVIRLVMVASEAGLTVEQAVRRSYILTDWGTSFAVAHARHFPDMPPPSVRIGPGRFSLRFLLGCGGATYLAEQTIAEYVESRRLFRVEGAPKMDRKVYAVFPLTSERHEVLTAVVDYLTPPVGANGSEALVKI
jgi:DNA-binding transcriptional LysR family regulator